MCLSECNKHISGFVGDFSVMFTMGFGHEIWLGFLGLTMVFHGLFQWAFAVKFWRFFWGFQRIL